MQAQVIRLTRYFRTNYFVRHLHSTTVINAGYHWRQRNNLPRFGNEYGPLRDNPDFTFKDGRSIPLTVCQIDRKKQQIEAVKTVFKLLDEIEYTANTEMQLKKEEQEKRQDILREKLKPKGNTLTKPSVN